MLIVLAAVLAARGGGGGDDTTASGPKSPAAATMVRVPTAPPAPDQPCNGRPGVEIPAVPIPEVRTLPVRVPERKLAGKTVAGFTVPGLIIGPQRVPAQCATIDPAPAGCLGRVSIPASEIPGVRIPAVQLPAVSAPGGSTPAVDVAAVVLPATRVDAVLQEQQCAQKTKPGEYQPSVYRPEAYRQALNRKEAYRKEAYRREVCVDGQCVGPVSVAPVSVAPVTVAPVSVAPGQLQGRDLPELRAKCVSVFADAKATAYQVCADVLFAFNRSDLRPGGRNALREIARSLKRRFAGRPIRVDGHTDAKGSPDYNVALSERRANTVAAFLQANGIAKPRITAHGYGEAAPVARNTRPDGSDNPAGRRQNRRVVVGVTRR